MEEVRVPIIFLQRALHPKFGKFVMKHSSFVARRILVRGGKVDWRQSGKVWVEYWRYQGVGGILTSHVSGYTKR